MMDIQHEGSSVLSKRPNCVHHTAMNLPAEDKDDQGTHGYVALTLDV
jgi:hypothetical protein